MVKAFQILSVCAVCYSFCSNMVLDVMSHRKGRSMARSLITLVFIIQGVIFFVLIPLSQITIGPSAPVLRLFAVATLVTMLESQTAFGVILSREIFGARNSAMIYGLADGLASGTSESSFTYLVSFFETRSPTAATMLTYVPYYTVGCIACFIGALLSCSLKRCRSAFSVR